MTDPIYLLLGVAGKAGEHRSCVLVTIVMLLCHFHHQYKPYPDIGKAKKAKPQSCIFVVHKDLSLNPHTHVELQVLLLIKYRTGHE